MLMNVYIQGLMVVILETLFGRMFLGVFFSERKIRTEDQKRIVNFLWVLIVYTIAVFCNCILLKEFFCYLLMFLAASILYDGRRLHIAVMSSVYFGLLLAVDYLTILLYTFFLSEDVLEYTVGRTIVLAISKLVLFFVINVIKKYFGRGKMSFLTDKEWLLFLLFPVFSIGIMVASVSRIGRIVHTEYEIIIWFLVYCVVGANMLLFYFLQRVVSREELLRETEKEEEKANQQLLLYQSFVEEFKNQNERMHEYKNQIECLQALSKSGNYKEIDRYLRQIGGELYGELDSINTNHPVVNAVLNSKYQNAYRSSITMILKVNDLSGLWLEEKDIVVILSNLLDNAIDALKNYPDRRIMKVKLVLEENSFIVSVENPYYGKLRYDGKRLMTSKTEESLKHGFGVSNVIKIVNKYHGFYAVRTDYGKFLFSILIPRAI